MKRKTIAKKPKIFDISKIFSEEPANAAIIAPTIIDIAIIIKPLKFFIV